MRDDTQIYIDIRNKARRDRLIKVFGAIAIIIIIITIIANFDNDNQKKSSEISIQSVRNFAEDEVKARLKSPSTAEFSYDGSGVRKHETKNFYFVDGFVDSQNGFGAVIRSPFRCKITYNNKSLYCNEVVIE